MKYLIGLCLFLFATTTQAGGIDFFHGSWEEAVAEAKAQDKIIFVDAYAEWCGPCKRMAKNVFTHDKVGEFYNANFVNLKLDMEKSENKSFRQKYPVSAFPTLFYIDYTGEIVQKVKGAQQVDGFINLGKSALSKIDRSGQYAEAYEAGDRDYELIYNYVKALNKAGKPSLKIANEYLRTQDNIDTPDNMKFIWVATNEADSRIFNLLIENKKKIAALVSEEKVNQQILKACRNTAQNAIEYENEDLLEEAKKKKKKYY
ncbi:MAG: thioredoxin family protein, partial [Saprospiraceae bacterium]